MARLGGKHEFVTLVAEEIASGIDCALRHWLGRIELEVIDRSLTAEERLGAIAQILAEYKARAMYLPDEDTPALPVNSRPACPNAARLRNAK